MATPAPDRICTLCHTQFKEGSTRGVGCAVNLVVFGVLVAMVQGLRLDVVAQVALVVAGLVASAWIERRITIARVQTCPSCGSRLTVPLGSPAGAALAPQAAPSVDPLTGVPSTPPEPAPEAKGPQQTQIPSVVAVVLGFVLLALLGVVVYTVHRSGW